MYRNETEFLDWLRRRTGKRSRQVKLGIGDDAAVVRPAAGRDLLLKSDMCIENVHFSLSLHSPHSVGYRALARPLSDIAAMGGTPRFVLVSLAVSKKITRPWIEDFYKGLLAIAGSYGAAVIGGDTALVSDGLYADVLLVGDVRRGQALTRSGARPGDQLYVSGKLGAAALGLRLLQARAPTGWSSEWAWRKTQRGAHSRRNTPGARNLIERASQRHLYPEPRCELGRFLTSSKLASAAIDLSDGLSTDLNHLCKSSGAGARIWADLIPTAEVSAEISQLLLASSRMQQMTPLRPWDGLTELSAGRAEDLRLQLLVLDLALRGGEDYELLFTVPPGKVSRVPRSFRGVPLRRIGEIHRSTGVQLVGRGGRVSRLLPAGYDHFRDD